MNLNFFLGTAAELIKVYPVILRALKRGDSVRVISSGQSRENFLMQYRDFGLPEEILVNLVESEGDLEHAGSAMKWFVRALCTRRSRFLGLLSRGEKNFVIVHGDTLSTLVGAWLGWRAGVTVAHVEAGLRSAQLFNPFPEEITRRLVSRFARLHFAPDERAMENLKRARVRGTIVNTGGNTLLDAVLISGESVAHRPPGPFVLVNVHRFENLNSEGRWTKILDVVVRVSEKYEVVFVAHPQTRHKLRQDPSAKHMLATPQIYIRDRMPFSEFIGLLKAAEYMISDGGSNQEECSYLGKPCLLMRESTERVEGLGTSCVLSRFNQSMIERFLSDPNQYKFPAASVEGGPSNHVLETLYRWS